MNQKNYSEIARIIYNAFHNEDGKLIIPKILFNIFVKSLADYFEKEEKRKYPIEKGYMQLFNRKQFLKDCGVD